MGIMPSFESGATARIRRPLQGADLVRKVEAWVEAVQPESIRVSDICAALNVSPRTLQRAFQEAVGMGPAHYLALKRLARARAMLRSADPRATSVTEIALDQGFWELGRFAGAYRRMFGEKPSETLYRR